MVLWCNGQVGIIQYVVYGCQELTAVKMVPPWRTINAVELAQGRVESIQATTEKLTAEQGREIRLRAAK